MIPLNLLPLLDGLSFDQLEQGLGNVFMGVFGSDPGGFFIIGIFFLVIMAVTLIKMGVGFEGTAILMLFAVFLTTYGVSVTGAGQGSILPVGVMILMILFCGYVIYLAFFNRY